MGSFHGYHGYCRLPSLLDAAAFQTRFVTVAARAVSIRVRVQPGIALSQEIVARRP